MFEQKNKRDIRIGDKEGPTVMVATEEASRGRASAARRGTRRSSTSRRPTTRIMFY